MTSLLQSDWLTHFALEGDVVRFDNNRFNQKVDTKVYAYERPKSE
jgi:hypothetical protein